MVRSVAGGVCVCHPGKCSIAAVLSYPSGAPTRPTEGHTMFQFLMDFVASGFFADFFAIIDVVTWED